MTVSTGRLIIVCGLPGSGKTTLAKWLEGKLRAVRLAPDEWMDAMPVCFFSSEAMMLRRMAAQSTGDMVDRAVSVNLNRRTDGGTINTL